MLNVLTKLPYFDQYINNNSPKYLNDNHVDYSQEEYKIKNPTEPIIAQKITK
jgi:hypothetical protein